MSVFEKVNALEFQNFLDSKDELPYLKKAYMIIFIIYVVVGLSSLTAFWFLRNWYLIKQRNFTLTFMNGILAFISGIVGLIVQLFEFPCAISLYSSNVINPLCNSIFLSRSLRIVLLYHYNIFKVTSLKNKSKRKIRESYTGEIEPNIYLPKIYRKVNFIINAIIIVPTIIVLIATIILQIKSDGICSFFETGNATEKLKGEKLSKLFVVAQVYGIITAVLLLIMFFFICRVKDTSKYGVKFECISTILLIVITTTFNYVLNVQINKAKEYHSKHDASNYPIRLLIIIYNYTKGGKVLFCIISFYMIICSITLPCIKCWKSKLEKNKYFQEPTSSIQYFYKVLNSPPLIEELKSIAIKEFSVENILFWENYQVLQKMVYRYQIEYKRAERIGNPRLVSQYDFEGYYQQQLQAYSVSSMDDYSYDPNMQVPREIMPYYINFYHTFIDSLSPASVNISGVSIKHIYNELCTYPTIGMFDNAKNEVVETMFTSIFPILLRQNRKHIRSNTIHY